jgi:transcriptional regulator with GAF, ATPase, and Fis domain
MDVKAIYDALNTFDYSTIYTALGDNWFNVSEENNPIMADSIGSLADKLATVNFKMAYNQELLYSVRKMSPEDFETKWKGDMRELHNVLKRCTDLNVQRSRLVDEIDKKLAAMFKGELNPSDLVNPQHKTY